MHHLVPCPGCQRHVRTAENACPFCGTALALAATPAPALPTARLGRAALFAFGATLACSLTTAGCGGDSDDGGGGKGGTATGGGGTGGGKGGSGGTSTGGGGSGGTATGGGGSGGSAGSSTGGSAGSSTGGAAGNSSGGFAGAAPLYGLPVDAGTDDDGGAAPLYGAPP